MPRPIYRSVQPRHRRQADSASCPLTRECLAKTELSPDAASGALLLTAAEHTHSVPLYFPFTLTLTRQS